MIGFVPFRRNSLIHRVITKYPESREWRWGQPPGVIIYVDIHEGGSS